MHLAIVMTNKTEFSRFDAAGKDINKHPSVNHYKNIHLYVTIKQRESFTSLTPKKGC